MVRKMILLFVTAVSSLYAFRALQRNRSAGEKILHKEADKDWESEGGNLAPQASSKA
jgi:hypothetical protein